MLDHGQDLDAAERWVDDWQSSIAERATRAGALSRRLADLTATVRSGDGLVEVTVASSGAVVGLHLDERIRGQSGEKTSEQILATIRAAQTELTRLATEATAEAVGLDNETGRAIVDSYAKRFGADDGR
jgi:DNA-binding protein YbaB